MAEGDTVVRAARRISEALAGEAVALRRRTRAAGAAGIERLDGGCCGGREARGKHLLLDFGATRRCTATSG